ncbi:MULTISPECIES: nuclear transport factor 2 family protein [Pseudomonas]|uniref:nuclear transport factor 2 family protein n=1 Tax=Pseudomonas TaxID=286 RepID=UPI003313EACB
MEISLHQASVRNDPEQLNRLLHKDFHEIGSSGAFYSKADTVESLPLQRSRVDILARNFKLTVISKDACLLVYEASQSSRDGAPRQYARRSSIWKLEAGVWQMLFHQGTPTRPFDPG